MISTTKKCPMCAEEIPFAAATCEFCGTRFEVTSAGYCQNCHEICKADETGHCRACGREILDWQVESKYVEKVQEPVRPSLPAGHSSAKKLSGYLWGIGVIVGIMLLVFFRGWWIGRGNPLATSGSDATFTPTVLKNSAGAPSQMPGPTLTSQPTPIPTRTPRPTATATPLPAWVAYFADPILAFMAQRPPNFEDDFEDKSGGWQKEDWCGDWRMAYQDGELVLTSCGAKRANIDYQDFALELEGRFLPETTGDSWWSVSFRDLGGPNYAYGVHLDGSVGLWGFTADPLVLSSDAANPDDQTNRLLVIAIGPRFAFYLNGQPFYYLEDSTNRWGAPSFRAWGGGSTDIADNPTTVGFDNFKIWDLGEYVPEALETGDNPTLPESALETSTPEDGFGVAGRILWDDQPLANVIVKLCAEWSIVGGCKEPVYSAITGEDGIYRITEIPAGDYYFATQVPGQRNETGWMGKKVAVVAGETNDAGDFDVIKYDLTLSEPGDNTGLTETTPTLIWESYAGAAYYKVRVARNQPYEVIVSFEKVVDSQYNFAAPLEPGEYVWNITAYNAAGKEIAESGFFHFVIAP